MRNTILSLVLLLVNLLAVSASACPNPSNLMAGNTTGTEATLTWDAVPGAVSYWVEVEQTLNNPVLYFVEATVTTNTFVATGLNPGTFYKFKVRTNCGGGDKSDWTEWYTFGAGSSGGGGGNTGCDVPTGLMMQTSGSTSAILSWNAVPGATKYKIEVEDASGNPNPFKDTATVTGTTYTVNGLTPGMPYKFKVRSKCGNGESDWTSWVTFVADNNGTGGGGNTGCGIPSGLSMQTSGSTSAILSWNAVAGATKYQIEVEDASGNPTSFKDTATVTGTNYTVNGLTPGMPYKFKVRSKCGGVESNWTGWAYFTADVNGSTGGGNNGGGGNSSCEKPTGMLALNVTTTGADLQWNAVQGAFGYTVEVESAQKMNNPFHLEQNITTNTFSVSGLLPGKLYKFKVRTRCSASGKFRSGWTNWVYFTTPTSFTDDQSSDREQVPAEVAFSIRLYPNPVSDALYVELNGAPASSTELRLFDLNGKLVMQEYNNNVQDVTQLNLSSLNTGMYILQVLNGEKQEVRKVLVTR